jgi:L-ascorbate metabolism protein UlaG (beta-lactamase superfamily)
VKITLIRHATLLLELEGRRLVVDPQLDEQGARPPIDNTPNPRRNPLVPLPVPAEEVVRGLDAIVVTHLHRDHLDETAERLLPRDVPVFCQPEDEARLSALGLQARPVAEELDWEGLGIHRTGGRHGTGAIGARLAPVSGFVLGGLYIAGDTIWCDEVADAVDRHRPAVAVVNAGGARFLEGDPIVMTAEDVREVAARMPAVVAVHMEAINHCIVTRAEVRAAAPSVLVPEDGETLELQGPRRV